MQRVLSRLAATCWAAYECLAMVLGLGALALMCLLALPFALILSLLPAHWRIPMARRAIAWGFRTYLAFLQRFCCVRLDCSALDALVGQYPLIIVANHPSLLDAVILLSRLPKATCVMKAGLKSNVLFGPGAHVSGYISNEDPMHLIKQACHELSQGAHLLLFPESTRTVQHPINAFDHTAALIALRSLTPIQTVFVEFSTIYLGKLWPIWKKPSLPLTIKVKLGAQFSSSHSKEALTHMLESHYRDTLKS